MIIIMMITIILIIMIIIMMMMMIRTTNNKNNNNINDTERCKQAFSHSSHCTVTFRNTQNDMVTAQYKDHK